MSILACGEFSRHVASVLPGYFISQAHERSRVALIPSCSLVLQPQIEGVRGVVVTTLVVNQQMAF